MEINQSQVEQIRKIPYFQASIYHDLDIQGTLEFFTRRYVNPLAALFDLPVTKVVDCGAGFGWFSFAYLLCGGSQAIAVDIDEPRLMAAKTIAKILGLADRLRFIVSPVERIPLSTDETDIFVSIETLEHIGRQNIRPALQKINQVAAQAILITTPNQLFPVVAHDTRIPFLHWLPPKRRRMIAKALGREEMEHGNEFLTPFDIELLMKKFRPWSTCLTFRDFREFQSHYPFYLPYGNHPGKRLQRRPSKIKAFYYRMAAALLGSRSYWLMPSLTTLLIRR